ncbi:MAG: hypothetical protein IH969_07325 [Candidatus Krumholzibacteriota bacterium]|nr:hypothetical protein [Candidatus Krumholzibacteriota bacterium]
MDRESKRKHQKQVCEAALMVVNERTGKKLRIVSSPDEYVRDKQAVDHVASDGDERLVIEHTRLESFPEQVSDDHRVQPMFETIERTMKGKLPSPGGYILVIAPHALIRSN